MGVGSTRIQNDLNAIYKLKVYIFLTHILVPYCPYIRFQIRQINTNYKFDKDSNLFHINNTPNQDNFSSKQRKAKWVRQL